MGLGHFEIFVRRIEMVREQLGMLGMLSQTREIRAGGTTSGVVSMLLVLKAVRCGQPREWVSIRKKRSQSAKGLREGQHRGRRRGGHRKMGFWGGAGDGLGQMCSSVEKTEVVIDLDKSSFG